MLCAGCALTFNLRRVVAAPGSAAPIDRPLNLTHTTFKSITRSKTDYCYTYFLSAHEQVIVASLQTAAVAGPRLYRWKVLVFSHAKVRLAA